MLITDACGFWVAGRFPSTQVMRFSWSQHQNVARKLDAVPQQQFGVALALMGVAILMLAEDLLDSERQDSIQ